MDRVSIERALALRLTRRQLLAGGPTTMVALSLPGRPTSSESWAFQSPIADRSMHPFTLGVASGDPAPDSVVIWTRLAPLPVDGGGMSEAPVEVRWEVALDDQFRAVLRSGVVEAVPELAHSVHVDVEGLEPAHDYFYRFMSGDWESSTGRTRTTPAAGLIWERLRFGFASCANWEHGYFHAYRDLAGQDLDFIMFVGDYLYEYPPGRDYQTVANEPVRLHTPGEAGDLRSYRDRHAQYKTDPDLQLAHRRHPWIVTWDDHEVENNYAGGSSDSGASETEFLDRRSAAYQAYYEHMPLRPDSMPAGPAMRLYRNLEFGDLVSLRVLDTRQHRSDQPCAATLGPRCDDAFEPGATLLGSDQEEWLLDGLAQTSSRWNILAQQVMMGELAVRLPPEPRFNLDQWDGYPLARNRLLGAIDQLGLGNVVVLTGDVHSAWVNDLKADFEAERSPVVATELVCTSVSAHNPVGAPLALTLPGNPHIRFLDLRHGYTLCDVERERWSVTFRATSSAADPAADFQDAAAFVIEHGQPGAIPG